MLACAYAFIGGDVDEFCLDDAWIHLSYAKSLRLGDGLSYNPGDWETGFSSPLWVVLLAAWPTGPDPVVSVKLLGALLHAATAGLASMIALELASARASLERPIPVLSIATLAGILCATSPTLLQAASSGMEVPLTTCLVLACLRACLRENWLLAAVLAFAAELARAEVLGCLVGFAIVAGLADLLSRPRTWASARASLRWTTPALGAAAGLAAWVLYCQVVSGWPWPNTAYVKIADAGPAGLAQGWAYLSEQVLPWQPWFAGVGGLALIAAALWTDLSGKGVLEPGADPQPQSPAQSLAPIRRWQLLALIVAYVTGMLGTAASRPLNPEVLFFEARYFAIFAPIPLIVIALGLARTHRVLSLVLVLPIALLTGLQIPATQTLQRAQERGIALLHGDPARYVSAKLPDDAVLAVEGAGSLRYRTPRSMKIIDALGLNNAAIAHAEDDPAKACALIEERPDYLVMPEHIAGALAKVFELRLLEQFVDPAYAQVAEPHEVRVLLLEVVAVRPRWAARCGGPSAELSP
ncbi:hypothetical protein DB30_02217 [Enhygromyxa salina]|uniref:Glycosyltransferase RgtA/B/C/D-like domain-containing protein n=1 Tax=Enhygromyxa salina TaxID=215803 RepID=A0A0C2DEB0_9BACT|nr:hypothetical protein DB30_02217 [Enhygromyxa salina]